MNIGNWLNGKSWSMQLGVRLIARFNSLFNYVFVYILKEENRSYKSVRNKSKRCYHIILKTFIKFEI